MNGQRVKRMLSAAVAAALFICGFTVPVSNISYIQVKNEVYGTEATEVLRTGGIQAGTKAENQAGALKLIPLGHTVGIKLYADGAMVVGISNITTETGESSPANECGLRKGDIITQINSEKIDSTEEIQKMLQRQDGGVMSIRVMRGCSQLQLSVTPVRSRADGSYKIGAWVRDSMAGIGTLTFYDPNTGVFGALGHGINDVDTLLLMPLASGAIMHSTITEIRKGEEGAPGQLQGMFKINEDMGKLYANTDRGIFGTMEGDEFMEIEPLPVASRGEVKVGPATILSNIDGDAVREYDIEIVKIYPDTVKATRNMLISVTDKRLLEAAGGIVQGMSGSPIIQDGKIAGAVTHVLIADPSKGYGIMIENMLSEAYWQDEKIA